MERGSLERVGQSLRKVGCRRDPCSAEALLTGKCGQGYENVELDVPSS